MRRVTKDEIELNARVKRYAANWQSYLASLQDARRSSVDLPDAVEHNNDSVADWMHRAPSPRLRAAAQLLMDAYSDERVLISPLSISAMTRASSSSCVIEINQLYGLARVQRLVDDGVPVVAAAIEAPGCSDASVSTAFCVRDLVQLGRAVYESELRPRGYELETRARRSEIRASLPLDSRPSCARVSHFRAVCALGDDLLTHAHPIALLSRLSSGGDERLFRLIGVAEQRAEDAVDLDSNLAASARIFLEYFPFPDGAATHSFFTWQPL